MPVLSNPRHEKFSQLLAEGKRTAEEAYGLCGYKPSRFNACHLANKPHIKERVQQITTEAGGALIRLTQITTERLVEMQQKLYDRAYENNQLSAGVSAAKEISILTGHRVERAEIGAPGEFDHLTAAELRALVIERLARLGLVEPQRAISNGSALNGESDDDE